MPSAACSPITPAMLRLYGPGCDGSIVDPNHVQALPPGTVWLDLEEPTRDEDRLVERWLGLDVPTRDELAEIEPSSRLHERNGALYMTLSTLRGVTEGEPAAEPIGFVLTADRLVTVRYATPKPLLAVAANVRREPALASEPVGIFLTLLDAIVDRLADELEEVAAEIKRVSAHVFRRPNGSERRNDPRRLELLLLRIGRNQDLLATIRLTAVSASRLVAFFSGSALLNAPGQDVAREHVRSLSTDVAALIDFSSFQADNLSFLMEASLGLISIDQNSAMKVFSWLAVVFLPPTLIAGVYGMNFEHMPELHWLLGYPWALGLIVLSMILPYWVLRRRGWL